MKGRKGSTDEGGVRAPLFIKWPGKIPGGKNIEQISGVIDLLPTLADLAGIDHGIGKPLDGVSLKSLLLEEHPVWSDRLIFNHWRGKISVRSQRYRLDHEGALFDMENDRGQTSEVSASFPEVQEQLQAAKQYFQNEVLSELPEKDIRKFSLGHPDSKITQIPARDGIAHGNIQRSNRYPNCSFFTNWISLDDQITWNVEVAAEGDFEVTLYYTCQEGDEGSIFELSFGDNHLEGRIETAFDTPIRGMENDRVERGESYVKDFRPLNLGVIHLEQGRGQLDLRALEIPGTTVMDVRLLMFERMN